MTFPEIHAIYDNLLRNDIIPFWLRHCIDREQGGLFTCIHDDGSRISTDKYMWSQCRGVWAFAAYYNRFWQNAELLDIARATAEFVLKHGRDEQGRFVFRVSREGKHLEGATSIYTDFFAVYGLGELHRATKETRYLEEAVKTFRSLVKRVQDPRFDGFAPYKRPEGIKWVHGIPMIGLECGQELADLAPEKDILEFVDWCVHRIMDHHVRTELHRCVEHLAPDNQVLDTPAGRCSNPGHSNESMWFVMHQGLRRKDARLVRRAAEVVRWMTEFGWDRKYGGVPHCRDFKDPEGPCWWPYPDTKPWWIAGETLYALLLSYEQTRDPWYLDWYGKMHEWAFAHYPNRQHGEWHQRLDRQGNVITTVIALPVKDPYHLPRNIMGMLSVLKRLQAAG